MSGLVEISIPKSTTSIVEQQPEKNYFPNPASEFVFVNTYAKWIEEKGRRETWAETVERYVTFLREERGNKIPAKILEEIHSAILNMEVMPSMRLMHTAGPAAKRDNTCAFNCSFAAVDYPDVFAEAMLVLSSGCGFGFSVERHNVEKLPTVPKAIGKAQETFVISDSREGWADSVRKLIDSLYKGADMKMDYSEIRPKGARLKTMGGRASGPEPLKNVHSFIRKQFRKAKNRKLKPIECHDIMNVIAEAIEVGGTRRSAEISLSDLSDKELRVAKAGSYPNYRRFANNSAVYHTKPSAEEFWEEWHELVQSGTGERGIFNLGGAKKNAPKRRNGALISGVNPCGEIMLRSRQFCNLTEIVVRSGETLTSLLRKARLATWIGAIQSTFTHFPHLSSEWKINSEEERLLGVSITGQHDEPEIINSYCLAMAKATVLNTATEAAKVLGITVPTATTCTKPNGNGSQVLNCASGAHPRHARHYLRRYRIASTSPLLKLIKDQGVPVSPESGQREKDWKEAEAVYLQSKNLELSKEVCPFYDPNAGWSESLVTSWVATFPIQAPENCRTRDDLGALDMLEHYRLLQTHWAEHSISMTVSVKPEEWQAVGEWVLKNWDIVNGLSFMPHSNSFYEQMPYETITKEEYEHAAASFPKIDYSQLSKYELEDTTTSSRELACSAGQCEI